MAGAETLDQALSSAYRYNPRIDAERARLRATDESVPQARAGYLPSLNGSADVNIQDNRSRLRDEDSVRQRRPNRTGDTIYPRGYGVSLQQNLFDGFRTRNSVAQAEATVRAGRESLRDIERAVLLEAVTAYMDVVRDKAVVRLQEGNVQVLSRELRATQDRFEVGEVTRTDVSQARARRAGAVSALDLARANLKGSRATYERVVGTPPSNLREPGVPYKVLPKSLGAAKSIGANEHPLVISALYQEQAARHSVDVVRGELLPTLNLEASYDNRFNTSSTIAETDTTTLTGRLNVPIYQGGSVHARVRASKHTHVSRLQEVEDARTVVREAVVTAWAQFQAVKAQLESDRIQVEANQTALTGVREEEKVGQRTLLDVLNAEQELVNAQVQLATTRRNLIVAAYTLLSSVGRLSVDTIGVAATVYDPEAHYFEVRRKWWGISITHADGRREVLDLWNSHGRHRTLK
ncbi:MAG: TolC family outer membrane protein [Alphaproteobacteria bacterium]|nr:TolC family outer membrane protein [Alphaproteobacteria bacterium]